MKLFGTRLSDACKAIQDLDERVSALEREASNDAQVKAWRNGRREFWFVKVVPAISALTVAILGINTATHWF